MTAQYHLECRINMKILIQLTAVLFLGRGVPDITVVYEEENI